MKDLIKISRQFFHAFLIVVLLVSGSAFAPAPNAPASCELPSVSRSGKTETSVSYAWNTEVPGSTYTIRYVRLSDNATATIQTGGNSATFYGLSSGTYRVYFQADCGESQSEEIIVDEVVI